MSAFQKTHYLIGQYYEEKEVCINSQKISYYNLLDHSPDNDSHVGLWNSFRAFENPETDFF